MLDESDVIEAVSRHLLEKGYAIIEKSGTDVDIIARKPESGGKILISAAGVARSKAGRGKLEASYAESQIFRSVTKSLYSALTMNKADEFSTGDRIALAFPDTPAFRRYLNAEKPVMDSLGIKIFLVTEEKDVVVL